MLTRLPNPCPPDMRRIRIIHRPKEQQNRRNPGNQRGQPGLIRTAGEGDVVFFQLGREVRVDPVGDKIVLAIDRRR